jgi:hypothetical protein
MVDHRVVHARRNATAAEVRAAVSEADEMLDRRAIPRAATVSEMKLTLETRRAASQVVVQRGSGVAMSSEELMGHSVDTKAEGRRRVLSPNGEAGE